MPDDPRNPLVILRRLHTGLAARRNHIVKAHRYYDGDHNLAFAGTKFLDAFGGLFGAFADNWCGVVANAPEERLQVNGFRVGEEPRVDADAKRWWETNDLDLGSQMGHLEGMISGAFYVTAWRGEEEDSPEITVESPLSTIVEAHPKIPSRRRASLRTYVDEWDGYEHAELFTADRVYLFRSRSKRGTWDAVDPARLRWVAEDNPDLAAKLDQSSSMVNPLGKVPTVEFINRPRLPGGVGWGAHSEIAPIMPIQDAVNKLCADLLTASEFAAYPQRYAVGYDPGDVVDASGTPTGEKRTPSFRSGPGGFWWLEDPDAEFGQFQAADLGNIVEAVTMFVQHIASISATPPHYLNASADRLSGESIKSAESGLVAKVRRIQRGWGAGWEEVMRIAGQIAGNAAVAGAVQMETVWRDPETRTEAEHIDALGKKAQMLNVPAPQLWEEAGYTPEQIARFPALRAQMQLEGMAAAAANTAALATARADDLRRQSIDATGTDPGAPATPRPALPPASTAADLSA